jgi:hypothetical protein
MATIRVSTLRQIVIMQVNALRDPTQRAGAEVRFIPEYPDLHPA